MGMRILIGVDGSLHAERAVRLVSRMGWPEGTTFRIVEALADPADTFGMISDEALATAIRVEMDGPLATAAAIIGRGEGLAERAVIRGRPADAILDEARSYAADVIVLGHRGHGAAVSLLIGSVAAEVVERATMPVLIGRGDDLGPVVLADDGSPAARRARGLIARWPAFRPYAIRVVSVASVAMPLDSGIAPTMRRHAYAAAATVAAEEIAEHDAIAEGSAAELRAAGLGAEPSAVMGDPTDSILATAARVDARLIVLGSTGRRGLGAILGSVARAVLLRAKCSVLVVPAAGVP